MKKHQVKTGKLLKYLGSEDQYAEHAYVALKESFDNREEFNVYLGSIFPPERKDLFLRLASFYRFLVKEARVHFSNPQWCSGLDYIDDTFKYIAIFSLIEASLGKNEYLDFYQYLIKKEQPFEYPIANRDQLDRLHREYKGEYGSIQNAVKFFEALDGTCKERLAAKLRVRPKPSVEKPDATRKWEELSIIELAKRLYDMRSEFVHKAEFVLSLNAGPSLSVRRSKIVFNELSLLDMMTFFEHGLLIQFGRLMDLHD